MAFKAACLWNAGIINGRQRQVVEQRAQRFLGREPCGGPGQLRPELRIGDVRGTCRACWHKERVCKVVGRADPDQLFYLFNLEQRIPPRDPNRKHRRVGKQSGGTETPYTQSTVIRAGMTAVEVRL